MVTWQFLSFHYADCAIAGLVRKPEAAVGVGSLLSAWLFPNRIYSAEWFLTMAGYFLAGVLGFGGYSTISTHSMRGSVEALDSFRRLRTEYAAVSRQC